MCDITILWFNNFYPLDVSIEGNLFRAKPNDLSEVVASKMRNQILLGLNFPCTSGRISNVQQVGFCNGKYENFHKT